MERLPTHKTVKSFDSPDAFSARGKITWHGLASCSTSHLAAAVFSVFESRFDMGPVLGFLYEGSYYLGPF